MVCGTVRDILTYGELVADAARALLRSTPAGCAVNVPGSSQDLEGWTQHTAYRQRMPCDVRLLLTPTLHGSSPCSPLPWGGCLCDKDSGQHCRGSEDHDTTRYSLSGYQLRPCRSLQDQSTEMVYHHSPVTQGVFFLRLVEVTSTTRQWGATAASPTPTP